MLLTGAVPITTVVTFTLVLIHLHPEEGLRPVMAEIDEVLGKKMTITLEDVEKLKYTEQVKCMYLLPISHPCMCVLGQVILETMRMYYPTNTIPRESPPGGITLDGHFIPPGTPIAVCYVGFSTYKSINPLMQHYLLRAGCVVLSAVVCVNHILFCTGNMHVSKYLGTLVHVLIGGCVICVEQCSTFCSVLTELLRG